MQEAPRVWVVAGQHWPRALIVAELAERGYEVTGFAAGREALAALANPNVDPPALLLIDLSGTEVSDVELEQARRLGPPILLIVGSVESGRAAVRAGGWRGVLRRPVTIGAVVEAVGAALEVAH